jgi:hypothetical protein
MTAWATWAEVGTALGTLVLAGATFSSVRASSRTARIAERALLASQRPVLAPSGPDDPVDQVQFADGRVFSLAPGRPLVERSDRTIYLATRCAISERASPCSAPTIFKPIQPGRSLRTPKGLPGTIGATRRQGCRRLLHSSEIS